MTEIVIGVIGFLLLTVLQSWFINGVYEFFRGYMDSGKPHGNLGYLLFYKFIEKHNKKNWSKPFWSCIICMSSVYGTISFFTITIMFFGFQWQGIIIWVFDIFIVAFLNKFMYKQV